MFSRIPSAVRHHLRLPLLSQVLLKRKFAPGSFICTYCPSNMSSDVSFPQDDAESRSIYEFQDTACEFTDDYGPGKLHPAHLGDLLDVSRYKILRKLGSGSFSTVWLARDRRYEDFICSR